MSNDNVIKLIRQFYEKNQRVPLKREFKHYKIARGRFGTWNKAITAAGFKPNPVMFAKKWIAKDGHKCDSLAEKIVDDWLYKRKISHEINVPYNYRNMTADFKINGILIEFLGLAGVHKKYDQLHKEKQKLWKKRKLQVIEIYPRDLFPKNKLGKLLGKIIGE